TILNQVAFVRRHGLRALSKKLASPRKKAAHLQLGSEFLKGEISELQYFEKTRSASVTIGINRVPSAWPEGSSLKYSRMRDIEAPMLGGCYLTEHTAGVSQLYEIGKEIETYETASELAEKIKDLLNSAHRRGSLRRAAQGRALNDHSVGRSIDRIS